MLEEETEWDVGEDGNIVKLLLVVVVTLRRLSLDCRDSGRVKLKDERPVVEERELVWRWPPKGVVGKEVERTGGTGWKLERLPAVWVLRLRYLSPGSSILSLGRQSCWSVPS